MKPMAETDIIPPDFVDEINDSDALQQCDSVIVCLQNGRFVVVRYDSPHDLWPCDGGWEKIRELKPGDEVVYKGDLTTIRAIEVYR